MALQTKAAGIDINLTTDNNTISILDTAQTFGPQFGGMSTTGWQNVELSGDVIQNGVTTGLIRTSDGTGTNNFMLGGSYGAIDTASNNVAIGANACTSLTIGSHNTVLGHNSGIAMTSGGANVILGSSNGNKITTTIRNIVVGTDCLNAPQTGSGDNIVIGTTSLNASTSEIGRASCRERV